VGIDAFLKKHGRGALSKLFRLTGVSPPTLRKIVNHEPVRLDTAAKVAEAIGCAARSLTHPRPLKKKAPARRKKKATTRARR
jgi:hypothetical protein